MPEPYKPSDAMEVIVKGYSKIILFRDERTFLDTLDANKHLKALYGTREYEKMLFHGVFVAAITARELQGE